MRCGPTPLAVDFVPEVGGWWKSHYALHEWIGWVWYSVRRAGYSISSASSSGRSIALYGSQRPIELR